MIKILLVEDDKSITKNLSCLLEQEGFEVFESGGQRQALEAISNDSFDILLIDISLPDGNGFAVCTAAKRKGKTPVIFLTASDDELSVVTGLELGADDYISKPFRPLELVSRIKTVLRRCGTAQSCFEISDLKVDTIKGSVFKGKDELLLSALEYKLLLVFINNKGCILSRNKLLESIWDVAGDFVNDNTLTVYIKRLREKIESDPQEPEIIKTVRGLGYRLGD